MNEIVLPKGERGASYKEALEHFANSLIELQKQIPYKVSARGWCYLLEVQNLITKDKFDYCEKIINKCRKKGYLPLDFIAVDKKRAFLNVDYINYEDPFDYISKWLKWARECWEDKEDIDFWQTQKCYIQMAVEKVDIVTLFSPICKKYHIPIANMVGWSDINSRGEMAQRFKYAEEELGLKPLLLYYGDFDPAGILIADFLKENLDSLKKATKWDPKNLTVDRFGLTIDFINENNLTWIDNLITSGKRKIGIEYQKYLRGDPKAKIYEYEIEYIKKYGIRKCEANAILPISEIAQKHCETKILGYLGKDCFKKYDEGIKEIQKETKEIMDEINIETRINKIIRDLEIYRKTK